MKILMLSTVLFFLGCTTTIPRQDVVGNAFPEVTGSSLDGRKWQIPGDIKGKNTLLLIGYQQRTQFDIDRWLIGIDQKGYKADILEIPTIPGWFPKAFSGSIDDGMRSGIPEELWKVVVTVYADADKIVRFTGNENPINARVIVVDERGYVKFMHDRGFSSSALNQLAQYFPGKA